jgi:hypothetical protein
MSSEVSMMSSRVSKVALAGAFAASAAFGQSTIPEQAPVKRPDGSVVYPATAGSVQSAPEPAAAMRPDGTVVRPNAAGIPGTGSDPVPVRRPDGTVVYPQAPVQRAPSISTGDSRADERERTRQQAQQAAEERIDQSRREREAASARPARQIPPTTLPR